MPNQEPPNVNLWIIIQSAVAWLTSFIALAFTGGKLHQRLTEAEKAIEEIKEAQKFHTAETKQILEGLNELNVSIAEIKADIRWIREGNKKPSQ